MALNVVNLDEGIYVELAGVIEVTGGLGWSDAGWQNLAAFRQGQKWPRKFSPSAYLQFLRQMRFFCKFVNLTQ